MDLLVQKIRSMELQVWVLDTIATSLSVSNLIAQPRVFKYQCNFNAYIEQQNPETHRNQTLYTYSLEML
jgi:hypothetical protein